MAAWDEHNLTLKVPTCSVEPHSFMIRSLNQHKIHPEHRPKTKVLFQPPQWVGGRITSNFQISHFDRSIPFRWLKFQCPRARTMQTGPISSVEVRYGWTMLDMSGWNCGLFEMSGSLLVTCSGVWGTFCVFFWRLGDLLWFRDVRVIFAGTNVGTTTWEWNVETWPRN